MAKVDKDQLKSILLKERDKATVSVRDIENAVKDFPEKLGGELDKAFKQWLEDRTVLDVKVEGLSLKEVLKKRPTHFLTAIKDLNYFFDPNKTEEEKKKWKEILSTPFRFQ